MSAKCVWNGHVFMHVGGILCIYIYMCVNVCVCVCACVFCALCFVCVCVCLCVCVCASSTCLRGVCLPSLTPNSDPLASANAVL